MIKVQDVDIGGPRAASFGGATHGLLTGLALPEQGSSWTEIEDELLKRKAGDYDWRGGRVPIYVYHDNDELLAVSRDAYNLFFSENALGRRAFPSIAGMEDEVVQMSLALFQAPEGAGGSFTSGGTESLFLVLKTARDRFRATRSTVSKPNIVIPITAHPAFDKAAQYLDIDVVRINVTADLRGDVELMGEAIGPRTMLIAGSAPCYPYGVFDPIAGLADLAVAKRVWLHVDACLGGFLAPFARDEGYPIPEFDFAIPGVTSLSADLHKFGFCAKGASVILYRCADLQDYQRFEFENWPRGSYSTDTFLGSRPAGSVASAWAVARYLGRTGYRRLARKIMEAKQRLVSGIDRIEGLRVLQPSELSIVLYRSNDERVDINAVADAMGERGWFVGRSREPRAIHLALNAVHAQMVGRYLDDLEEAVRRVRVSGKIGAIDDGTY